MLYASFFSFIYFIYLVYISYYPPVNKGIIQIVRFVGELLTIPLLLFLIFSFFYSLIKLFKKQQTKIFATIFIINLFTLIFFIFA